MKTLFFLLLLVAMPAQTKIVDATLLSYQKAAVMMGGLQAGGIGRFWLRSDVSGDVGFLGNQFFAQCLEPGMPVKVGRTYRFDVVPLDQAPKSIGGMGERRADRLKAIYSGLALDFGLGSMRDLSMASAQMQSVAQMATYETIYEIAGEYAFRDGGTRFEGPGVVGGAIIKSYLGKPPAPGMRMMALLNDETQDFLVFVDRSVAPRAHRETEKPGAGAVVVIPAPDSLALLLFVVPWLVIRDRNPTITTI